MKQKFTVTGMTCSACSVHVDKAVRRLEGVTEVNVNLLGGSMTVEWTGSLSADGIIAAVTDAGYGASLPTAGSSPQSKSAANAMEEDLKNMKRRLIASIVFLIPLFYLSMGHMMGWPIPRCFHGIENALTYALTLFLLTIPILIINQKYFRVGFKTLWHRSPNMDALIAVGSGAAVVYGIIALYFIGWGLGHGDTATVERYSMDLYFESAGMIVTLITVGKYLETRSKGKTGQAIARLMDLSPKTATILRGGVEVEIPVEQVQLGDLILVRPGGSVPVDGVVVEGASSVDESALTGESIPVDKAPGDSVISASINKSGVLTLRATRVGEDTTLAQMIRLVDEAASSKAPIAKLADKVAGVFVPVVMAIAVVTAIVWLVTGHSVEQALTSGVAVLVISCPCALGLATPVAIMVGTGKGAEQGILIKSAEGLERLRSVTTIVLDKTGTITQGKPQVTDLRPLNGISAEELLCIVASLEKPSEHPLGAAIVEEAARRNIPLAPVTGFEAIHGKGVKGSIQGADYFAGNAAMLADSGVSLGQHQAVADRLAQQGKTPLFFVQDGKPIGIIAVADTVKSIYSTNGNLYQSNGLTGAGVPQIPERSIWDIKLIKVQENDVFDPFAEYSTTGDAFNRYTDDETTDTVNWTQQGTDYIATSANSLYKVDSDYLYLDFYVLYGTKINLSVANTYFSKVDKSGDLIQHHFSGWYLYRQGQLELSQSVINYGQSMSFYATKDFYSNTIDIVAKYSTVEGSQSVTTTKKVEVIDETGENFGATGLTLGAIDNDPTLMKDNVLTYNNRQYLFTGWWQIVTDSTRPSTYLLVSNDYFDKNLPKVTVLVARFVRLTQMIITVPQADSGYIKTNLNYRYLHTPNSVKDNRVYIGTDGREYRLGVEAVNTTTQNFDPNTGLEIAPTVTQEIVFTLPIDTYVNNTKVYAWAGHYYIIEDTNGADPVYGTHYDAINNPYEFDESYRLTNTIGDRYNTQSINYIEYNNKYYYLNNNTLYNSVAYSVALDKVVYYNKTNTGYVSIMVGGSAQSVLESSLNFNEEITFANVSIASIDSAISSYTIKTNMVVIKPSATSDVTSQQPIINGSYVVYNNTIYYVVGSYLYEDIDFTSTPIVDSINYLVSNSVVIFETSNNPSTAGELTIVSVNKVGYKFVVESDFDLLTIINGGYTISYIVSTIEGDESYGGGADDIVGGEIVKNLTSIRTVGGTVSPQTHVYSETFPILNITLKPYENYTFIGLYINGEYVENSYNNLTLEVDLSTYSRDIVVEAKFAKNVAIEFRIAVDNNESKEYIGSIDEGNLLKELFINGTITNIYNSINASYVLGDDFFESSSSITDIKIQANKQNLMFTITVPYGTKLHFGVQNDKVEVNPSPTAYHFNGWYLLENESISTSTSLVSDDNYFDIYAIEKAQYDEHGNVIANSKKNTLSFVAKYSLDTTKPLLVTTSKVQVHAYDDTTYGFTTKEYDYLEFLANGTINSSLELNNYRAFVDAETGATYLFTGWWQEINKDMSVLISSNFDETGALQGNCIARFIEYRAITIDYTEDSSISLEGNMHMSYGYIQTAGETNMLPISVVSGSKIKYRVVDKFCSIYFKCYC